MFLFIELAMDPSGDFTIEFLSISLEFMAADLFFLKSAIDFEALDLEIPLLKFFKDLWAGDRGDNSIVFSSS